MTDVTLPTPESNPGKAEWSEVYANDKALREVVNGELDNGNLSGSAGITTANLAGEITTAKLSQAKFTWYTPKVIATEETRSNTAFGFLTTEDKIESVVVPTNGLVLIGYSALFKSSSANAGRAAIFLGSNQLKVALGTQEAQASEVFKALNTYPGGLVKTSEQSSFVTTGEALGFETSGGFCVVHRLAAGTYTIGVQFKATSGSVTAKERALSVGVFG